MDKRTPQPPTAFPTVKEKTKYPKEINTYCPKCKHHTPHAVAVYKAGKQRTLSRGARRRERRKHGYGGATVSQCRAPRHTPTERRATQKGRTPARKKREAGQRPGQPGGGGQHRARG